MTALSHAVYISAEWELIDVLERWWLVTPWTAEVRDYLEGLLAAEVRRFCLSFVFLL